MDKKKKGESIDQILPTTNEEEMKKMMKKLDKDQAYREHKCWRQYITVVISVCFVFFQFYATLTGHITAQVLRASHLAFVQLLAFLLFPPSKKKSKKHLTMVRCCTRLNWSCMLALYRYKFSDVCPRFYKHSC